MPIKLVGEWDSAQRAVHNVATRAAKAIDAALEEIARQGVTQVQRNLDAQGKLGGVEWPKLSVLTMAAKPGVSKMLVNTGGLRNAISYWKVRGGYSVGVRDGTRTAKGADLSAIAHIHEHGGAIPIKWTPERIRAFWALVGKTIGRRRRSEDYVKQRAKSGTTIAVIPARPFLRPVLRRFGAHPSTKMAALRTFARVILAGV